MSLLYRGRFKLNFLSISGGPEPPSNEDVDALAGNDGGGGWPTNPRARFPFRPLGLRSPARADRRSRPEPSRPAPALRSAAWRRRHSSPRVGPDRHGRVWCNPHALPRTSDGERVRGGSPAVDIHPAVAMTHRTARRRRDRRPAGRPIAEPQRISVQHDQVVGIGGEMQAGRHAGRRLRGSNEQRGNDNKRGDDARRRQATHREMAIERSRNGNGPAFGRKIRRLWFNDTVPVPIVLAKARSASAPPADSLPQCQSTIAAVKPNKRVDVEIFQTPGRSGGVSSPPAPPENRRRYRSRRRGVPPDHQAPPEDGSPPRRRSSRRDAAATHLGGE